MWSSASFLSNLPYLETRFAQEKTFSAWTRSSYNLNGFWSIQGDKGPSATDVVFYAFLTTAVAFIGYRLLSRSKIQWHHADTTIKFKSRRGPVELSQLCKSITPSLYLNPFVHNNHIQTLMCMFDSKVFALYFRRLKFESHNEKYEGTFAVDLTSPPFTAQDPQLPPRTAFFDKESEFNIGSNDCRPMLVVLHGLCGGSHEQYIQHVLAPLALDEQQWEACVVLSRGCGESAITAGGMYYAHATSDVRQVVQWLQKVFPNRPLYGAGFSMGANILTRYIAEEGDKCVLNAAVVVSNPWNLEITALHLQRTFFGRWLYSPAMTANLMRVFRRNAAKIKTKDGEPLDLDSTSEVQMMHEYDRHIQCPTWGFPTERVYYRQASSSDSVLKVRIPFWAINAEDDPIVGEESLPKAEFCVSPYTVMCTTDSGGHLGWFQLDGKRWYARSVISFFQNMHGLRDVEKIVPEEQEEQGKDH